MKTQAFAKWMSIALAACSVALAMIDNMRAAEYVIVAAIWLEMVNNRPKDA